MEANCLKCGKPFVRKWSAQKFCSKACSAQHRAEAKRMQKLASKGKPVNKPKRKLPKNMQDIIDFNLKALELGFSYGQYEMHCNTKKERGQASSSKSMQTSSIA